MNSFIAKLSTTSEPRKQAVLLVECIQHHPLIQQYFYKS
jgi:hypothetical protein